MEGIRIRSISRLGRFCCSIIGGFFLESRTVFSCSAGFSIHAKILIGSCICLCVAERRPLRGFMKMHKTPPQRRRRNRAEDGADDAEDDDREAEEPLTNHRGSTPVLHSTPPMLAMPGHATLPHPPKDAGHSVGFPSFSLVRRTLLHADGCLTSLFSASRYTFRLQTALVTATTRSPTRG